MRADDPNLPDLRRIAEALGELREQVVFVGGAVAGLLVTDPLADSVRATRDVDAVVNANRAMFHRIEEQVAERGFVRDASSEVICRWVHKASGVVFDLMPVQPEVLGFTNRWYAYAVQTAEPVDLGWRHDTSGECSGLRRHKARGIRQPRWRRLHEQPRSRRRAEHRGWARGVGPGNGRSTGRAAAGGGRHLCAPAGEPGLRQCATRLGG